MGDSLSHLDDLLFLRIEKTLIVSKKTETDSGIVAID